MQTKQKRHASILLPTLCLALSIVLSLPTSAQDAPPLLGTKQEAVDASNDTTLDATLPTGFILSGTVQNADESPVVSGTVTAQSDTEAFTASILPLGLPPTYTIALPAGTYKLSVTTLILDLETEETESAVFVTTELAEPVTVTSNTTRNIVLPAPAELVPVTGLVTSAGTLPTTGSILYRSLDETIFGAVPFEDTYSLNLPPVGDYEVAATLALDDAEEPATTLLVNVGTTTVTKAHIFDITLPATNELAGTVLNSDGTPATPSTVFAMAEQEPPETDQSDETGEAGGNDETEDPELACAGGTIFPNNSISTIGVASVTEESTTGAYSLQIPTGAYNTGVDLELELTKDALTTTDGNLGFPIPSLPLTVSSNLTQDFKAPALPPTVFITGTVIDENMQPVADAEVSASTDEITNTPNTDFTTTGTTDSEGKYAILALSGVNYTVIFCPPSPLPTIPTFPTAATTITKIKNLNPQYRLFRK